MAVSFREQTIPLEGQRVEEVARPGAACDDHALAWLGRNGIFLHTLLRCSRRSQAGPAGPAGFVSRAAGEGQWRVELKADDCEAFLKELSKLISRAGSRRKQCPTRRCLDRQ